MEFARLASIGFAVIVMAVACEAIAVEAIGRIRLPGTSVQAQPPVGWSCFMDTMTVYGKETPRLVCRSADHRMADIEPDADLSISKDGAVFDYSTAVDAAVLFDTTEAGD